MSAGEDDREGGFLGRWSKRKALARDRPESDDASPENAAAEPSTTPGNAQAARREGEAAADELGFDLSKLPSLEDITAQTNLSDFMRKEVPAALRNAALRRAWALDPAIRDYVNPAREYAYDWNVPGGVPGNGPIEAGIEALKQVAATFSDAPTDKTLGVGNATDEEPREAPKSADETSDAPSPVRLSEPSPAGHDTKTVASPDTSEKAAEQPEPRLADASDLSRPRRRHGGAAPV